MAGWKHARKTTPNLSHCRSFSSRYLKEEPLEYEAGLLTCQPRSDDG